MGRQTTPQAETPDEASDEEKAAAHLILNSAAGSVAAFRGGLTEAARERGIRARVLEPGQDVRLAALAAVDDGAESLVVAGGDGSVAAVAGVAAATMRAKGEGHERTSRKGRTRH